MSALYPPVKNYASSAPGSFEAAKQVAGAEKPTRILIVEDEYLIALEIEHRLRDAGFEVTGIAVTADEAISKAESDRPDLAIMDIRLAGRKDGVQAAIELFTKLGIRSIFASAHADAKTRERGSAASPIGWLQKPYTAEALIKLIKRHLG
ncbi:response regulator [Rhizobium leucaenae]|uniref:DNA-binding NarL/FixJ family response regulator n=1 Tax=Rhizobium leucaenae TaxID=29450 RepID=A0A7W7EPJ1_9HYPH|nr:response regulator [Rhizobium leucaenae]MBB4571293.1 DNA-binding NarL/FixJ family response regulator [Rhizobium leucaenae]MBB6305456.1 DNA-binding NarL/FixJ family response regulator [Rhizobium leucaenae]